MSWRASLDGLDARRTAAVSLLADQAGVTLRQAALLAELDRMAHNDPLTMLLNRRGWNKQLEQVLSLADRAGHPLTIALADIDFFKRYNDEFGHQAGDILLRDFATAAADAVRTHDVVARWGGEEFALALPNCSNADAFAVLDRIRQAVPSNQTCSIGFATWRRGESGSDVIARADRALYRAKTSGRNQIRSGEVELGVVSG